MARCEGKKKEKEEEAAKGWITPGRTMRAVEPSERMRTGNVVKEKTMGHPKSTATAPHRMI